MIEMAEVRTMEERVSRLEGILEGLPSRIENLDRKAD